MVASATLQVAQEEARHVAKVQGGGVESAEAPSRPIGHRATRRRPHTARTQTAIDSEPLTQPHPHRLLHHVANTAATCTATNVVDDAPLASGGGDGGGGGGGDVGVSGTVGGRVSAVPTRDTGHYPDDQPHSIAAWPTVAMRRTMCVRRVTLGGAPPACLAAAHPPTRSSITFSHFSVTSTVCTPGKMVSIDCMLSETSNEV